MQVCPKCNTPAYDDTSNFCSKCGAQLLVPVREKKRSPSQIPRIKVPVEKSINARDESFYLPHPAPVKSVKPDAKHEPLSSIKQAPILPVKPESTSLINGTHLSPKLSATHSANLVETCARCGGPINDKSRIFCNVCGVYIREEPSGDMLSIVKYPVPDTPVKSSSIVRNTPVEGIHEQSVLHSEEMLISPHSKNKWKWIAVIAGIVTLFLIYMLILLLIYLAEGTPTFPVPK